MAYTRVNWSELTPLSAANLNNMDEGIYDVDQEKKVVQIKTDTCAADTNSTTSTTYVNSNLSVTITPKYSDSLILVIFSGDIASGTYVKLYNSTNSADLDGASGAYTTAEIAAAQVGLYTVNSTAARTFLLQYKSYSSSSTARVCYRTTGLLVALEVRP